MGGSSLPQTLSVMVRVTWSGLDSLNNSAHQVENAIPRSFSEGAERHTLSHVVDRPNL